MSDSSAPVLAGPVPPRSYLGWSLAATALCFLPLGLIAIFYGFRTNRAVLEDRPVDAIRASRTARRWLITTIAAGLLVDLLLVIVLAMLGAFSS